VRVNTASAVVSAVRQLEGDAAGYYEVLAERNADASEALLQLAQESRKNITQVERAYYGVISDALEGCFAFDIDPDEFAFSPKVSHGAAYAEGLDEAIRAEQRAADFYSLAAEQSKALLADVARALARIARRRGQRITRLGELRGSQ
jgi:hypothetical protein